jgi:hypothetical protein
MSTSFRTYRAIKQALLQAFRVRRQSHQECHVITLALLICGIVGSRQVQFAKVVEHAPFRARKNESIIKRFGRWVQHDDITYDAFFLPFAHAVVQALAHTALTLVLDGSTVGRGCIVLMASVVYRGRALPVAWMVVRGAKGHLPQELHCALVAQLRTIIPLDTQVTLLGDGEFDGTLLQGLIQSAGWRYICRTAATIVVQAHGNRFYVGDLPLKRDDAVAVFDAMVTNDNYGPVTVIGVWEADQDEPLYLVSNLQDVDAAIERYRLRFSIETLFADQKSRGFHVHKSQLREPTRINRLLIATCLAYLWVVAVGVFAHQQHWVAYFHRTDRCDLSLFQVGLRAITYALREGLRLPPCFVPPPE